MRNRQLQLSNDKVQHLGLDVATSCKRKFTCQGQTSNGMPDAHAKVTEARKDKAERNCIKNEFAFAASEISKNRYTPPLKKCPKVLTNFWLPIVIQKCNLNNTVYTNTLTIPYPSHCTTPALSRTGIPTPRHHSRIKEGSSNVC